MTDFFTRLERIDTHIKEKRFDEAWRLSNKAVIELRQQGDDMWFMMYYQMAVILAKEEKWFDALEKMGFVVHYLKGVGGTTHTRFIERLLKKYDALGKYNDYINLSIKSEPSNLNTKLRKLIVD